MDLVKMIISILDKKMGLLALFIFVAAITLTVVHFVLVKKKKSLKVWRMLCIIPLAVCIVHCAFCHLRGGAMYTVVFYGLLYFTAVLMAVWQFLAQKKLGYRVLAVLVNLFMVVSLLTVLSIGGMYSSINNFTALNYTEAFQAAVDKMQEEYVLSEWKEIDYDALEAEILPMVQRAEQEQDMAAYEIALMTYCYRFNDSHVQYIIENEQCEEEIRNRLAGNDYGFSMITLDNGDTVAILADEESEAYKAGIQDGTIITQWNGIPVEEAKKEVECIYPTILSFPVAQNEEYMKTIFLAGTGEEENRITFINHNGDEQTVELRSIGSYRQRLETAIACFYHFDIPDKNFSAKMLNDYCGYLRINSEMFTIFDSEVSITGEYTGLAVTLEETLTDMQNDGMTKLIIDLRNNEGGSDDVGPVVASLFAEDEYFSHAYGIYREGEYISQDIQMVPANGKFSDVEVVVLVNAQCCSAGDALAENLSNLPNVTVMGITTSCGVDQGVGGWCFMTDCQFSIGYPNSMLLDENGEPRIDTRADRVSRIPLDEPIALTDAAVEAIFSGEGDYELEYALDYLERKK